MCLLSLQLPMGWCVMSCAQVMAVGGRGQTSVSPASTSSGEGPASTLVTCMMGKILPLHFSLKLLTTLFRTFMSKLFWFYINQWLFHCQYY